MSVVAAGPDNDSDVDVERAPVSEDGRYVAFASSSSELVPPDTNGLPDVFVRDRSAAGGPTTFASASALAATRRTTSACDP